jgi:hypothetical protein
MAVEYWIVRWSLSSGGAFAPTRWRTMTAVNAGYEDASHTTGLTPGSAVTRSRKAAPRISKLRY